VRGACAALGGGWEAIDEARQHQAWAGFVPELSRRYTVRRWARHGFFSDLMAHLTTLIS
jgi:hypothetical protein